MRIYYIANSRLPTIKAYGLQIAKMCEAFTIAGFDCELIIPKRHKYPDIGQSDITMYYNIKTRFKVTELKAPDLIDINLGSFLNKILFWIQQLSFARSLKKYLVGKEGVVYSRDQFSLSMLDSRQYKLYWEAHNFPKNIGSLFYKKILTKINGLIVISRGLKDDFAKYYSGPITIAPDGVDLNEFDIKISKEEAREKIDLPLDKKIVMYTGHLYEWKGATVLLEVARNFQTNNILFVFVGGTEYDIEKFRKKAENLGNVLILGHKPHQDIPIYLKSADVLVLPNSAKEEISSKYTSPLKLFEYMASGQPIVASDLSSIREILNDRNSVLIRPDDPYELAEGIKRILGNENDSSKLASRVFEDVHQYTWRKRAEKIIDFISL